MKNKRPKQRSSISSGIVPSAAVTAALLPSAAFSGTGDLDPAFGSIGRLGPILYGPAWSVEAQEDGNMLLGGGRPGYSYAYWGSAYYSPPTAFIHRLTEDGKIDDGYVGAVVEEVQVRDIARQSDGQVIAVGRRYLDSDVDAWQLAVYRVLADGSLDTTFAGEGLFTLSPEEHGKRQVATSVVLDPDGRIVIAGSRDDNVIVLRLLPDGSFDDSFGTGGIVVGPSNLDFSSDGSGARTSILRDAGGGYRLTASNTAGCQLLALTADGAFDVGFGSQGLATVRAAGGTSTHCNAIARQADDRILIAGRSGGQGFVARVLANGQPDPEWSADSVASDLSDASAIATAADGTVVIGGESGNDGVLMRLGPNGAPDPSFGNGGSTVIDLEYGYPSGLTVHDIHIDATGRVIAVGGVSVDWSWDASAFAVRLLGDAGGESPGVIGFTAYQYFATAEGDEVVVSLRRSGGSSGTVSVAYGLPDDYAGSATLGFDYDMIPGRVSWTDGDMADQQIRIPIAVDNLVEGHETILLELSDVQGGAGLGAFSASAEIPADGKPFGQLYLGAEIYTGREGASAEITLLRDYYSTGAVSVTVTPSADTAEAGTDFDASPVTVSWADGEWGAKSVFIPIVDDTLEEVSERFSIDLTSATGGAILATPVRATVTILSNDRPPAAPRSSGSGSIGLLSLLVLGAMTLVQRVFQYRRPKPASQLRGMPTDDCRNTCVK